MAATGGATLTCGVDWPQAASSRLRLVNRAVLVFKGYPGGTSNERMAGGSDDGPEAEGNLETEDNSGLAPFLENGAARPHRNGIDQRQGGPLAERLNAGLAVRLSLRPSESGERGRGWWQIGHDGSPENTPAEDATLLRYSNVHYVIRSSALIFRAVFGRSYLEAGMVGACRTNVTRRTLKCW